MTEAGRVFVVAVLGLLLLGIASCGDDGASPAPPLPEPPAWPELATEQDDEAERLGVPVKFENDLKMRFVLIPAGRFQMEAKPGTKPSTVRSVRITRPYYVQITEVTNAHYCQFRPKGPPSMHLERAGLDGDRQPVADVSWEEAAAFAGWLSEQDGYRTYRLPTEAEWEYACRAGTTTTYWSGESESDLERVAWYAGNSGRTSHNVGTKPPSPWGLFDMHGNVWEWCSDWYEHWRSREEVSDPTGPAAPGERGQRVFRGGGWMDKHWMYALQSRESASPESRWTDRGFRLVSPLPEQGD